MTLHKKIIILMLVLSFITMPVFAQEGDFDGYIVKYKNCDELYVAKEPPMALFGLDSEIEFIVPDYNMELLGTPSDPYYGMQWNVRAIKAQALWDENLDGDGVKVAVIDSGVNDFGELTHCLLPGKNCIAQADVNDTADNNGHGTFVSGIIAAAWNNVAIAGIAPGVKIVPYKVARTDAKVPTSAVLTALDEALKSGCKIINMSLGIKEDTIKDDTQVMNLWKSKLKALGDSGAILIAAVGNSGTQERFLPAGFDGVIGVGAVYKDANNKITHSPYSQVNDSIFVVAPGGATFRNESGSLTYSDFMISISASGSQVVGNVGTSFSAPAVSAMAALMAEKHPLINHEMFERVLMVTSNDMGQQGYDTTYGHGILNGAKMASMKSEEVYNILNTDFVVAQEKLADYTSVTMYNFSNYEKTFKIVNFVYDSDKKLDELAINEHKIGRETRAEFRFSADGGKAFVVDEDILNPLKVITK